MYKNFCLVAFLISNVLLFISCKDRASSELRELPEAPITDMFNEDSDYDKNLQAKFGTSGLNFKIKLKRLLLDSPINRDINLLSRFGTPTIAKTRLFEDGDPIGLGYFHEALDIARKIPAVPDTVYAPVSGKAKLVFDENPESERPEEIDGFSTSIVIHDKESNALISILHVDPLQKFYQTTDFLNVNRGEAIGTLARVEDSVIPDRPEFRHVHLMIIDFEKLQFINPSQYLRDYKDTQPPQIKEVVFYDENRQRRSTLVSGKLDLVVSVFDVDNHSSFNQEIASMSVVVLDRNDKKIFELVNCNFEDFWFDKKMRLKSPLHAVNIKPIFDSIPAESTNVARENIYFEFAATNLKLGPMGQCEIIDDADGYMLIDDSHSYIAVQVEVTDHFGNTSKKEFEFVR